MDQPQLQYVPAVDFYGSLGISFEFGSKLVKLGVLKPDALLNSKPIFRASLATVGKAQAAITQYRARQARAQNNMKELTHDR